MKSSRILVAALSAALAVPLALAAGLTSPTTATIGTQHTIDAAGLTLPNKPKVALTYSGPLAGAKGDPKAKAKVVDVDGTNVTFEVKKAKGSGAFDVTIKGLPDDLGSIDIVPPDLQGVNLAEAAPGDSVILNGVSFGAKKPKVTVNGKRAKVTAYDQTSITITVHKKTPGGAGDIVVKAKTGEDTLNGQLQVNVPPKPVKGKDMVQAKFGNIAVNATAGKTGHQVRGTSGAFDDSASTVFGSTARLAGTTLITPSIQITFPVSFTNPAPGVWTGGDVVVLAGEIRANLGSQTIRGYTHSGDTLDEGSSFSVTVTSVSGNRISGTFNGTLVPGDNTSGGNISCKGKFTVTLANP